jgi:NAD(P)H-nitrite reductase large subunit
MKYVIIGNGAAGIAAAEKIRKLDYAGEIFILSSEKYNVYSKCLLADFLSGQISEERMFIRNLDFYEKNKFKIYYEHRVASIDFKSKHVLAQNLSSRGKSVIPFQYDKLLIATGSAQILPPIEGLTSSNSYFLSTLDEAKKIINDSKDARRVLIIGGGFVGLEAAFNLYKQGKEVTIVERFPRVLQEQLDEKASSIIQNFVEEEGIRLVLNATVKEISSSFYSDIINIFTGNRSKTVVLSDGRKLKADLIILATGSKPNLDFIKNSNLKINRGIIVDPKMQTSIKDVYAAGDVVETTDAVTGNVSLSPIWPNAVIQGEIAASNMVGCNKDFDNLISMQNASEFREIPMISMGITSGDTADYEVFIDYRPVEMIYRKLVVKDNIIIGMIFLGDIKNAGVIGSLMKQKINVCNFKNNMLNSNFGYSEVSLA